MEQEVVGGGPRSVGIVGSSGGGGQEGRGLWIFRVVWVARRAGEVGGGVGGRGGMRGCLGGRAEGFPPESLVGGGVGCEGGLVRVWGAGG